MSLPHQPANRANHRCRPGTTGPLFCLVPPFGGSPFLMRPSTIRSAPPAVRPSMDARPGGPGRPAGQTCMLLTLLSVASSYSRVSHVRNCATAAEAVRSQISLDVTVRRRVTGPSRCLARWSRLQGRSVGLPVRPFMGHGLSNGTGHSAPQDGARPRPGLRVSH